MPAAVGGERDPPSGRSAVGEQPHGDVDDLLRGVDELDARGEARRLDGGEVAGERARVRAGRAGARLRGAPGEQHDGRPRLDGRGRGARELPPVAEVLAVERDQPGRLVVGERRDQLGRLHVGLVAERDEAGEPEAELGPDHPDLEREIPALGDEADRAGLELLRADLELGARVVDAEAVRAHEDGPGGAHALDDRPLARRPLLAHLAEPGADGDDRLRADGERVLDGLLDPGRRHGDDDELGRLRQLRQRRVGLISEDLAAPAVDEEDGAAALALERAAGEPETPLPRDRRGAQDCDRPGVEERAEVPRQESRRREMISRWMSDVPSSISSSFASRIHFSTGYSRE